MSRIVWECSPKKGGKFHLKLNRRRKTDSAQVPWGKDAKNFEKRVKSTWNCWEGSVWGSYSFLWFRINRNTSLFDKFSSLSLKQTSHTMITQDHLMTRWVKPPWVSLVWSVWDVWWSFEEMGALLLKLMSQHQFFMKFYLMIILKTGQNSWVVIQK